MYLRHKDYSKFIQDSNLQQIINADDTIRTDCELIAQEEIISYLVQKYDTAAEFQDILVFDMATAYKANRLVYLTATAYSATKAYALNDLALYNGNVYYCKSIIALPGEAWNAAHWTLLGVQYALYYTIYPETPFDYNKYYNIGDKVFYKNSVYTCQNPISYLWPDDLNNGSAYWGTGVAYIVAAATAVTNTTYWLQGDNRSAKLVSIMADITLYHIHKRIAPRNIPDLRVKAYDDAIIWLRDSATGQITPDIPLIQPTQGLRIRYGYKSKNNNLY